MEKQIELLKKLKELADRGIGGEKTNAQKMLDNLLKKHNLTLEDIGVVEKSLRVFKVKRSQRQFFMQVAASVIGNKFSYWNDRNTFTMELTVSQFIEIDARYDFYWKEFKNEEKIFWRAFIQRNHLYALPTGKENNKPMTKEEKAELLRVLEMASNIKNKTLHKQIGG